MPATHTGLNILVHAPTAPFPIHLSAYGLGGQQRMGEVFWFLHMHARSREGSVWLLCHLGSEPDDGRSLFFSLSVRLLLSVQLCLSNKNKILRKKREEVYLIPLKTSLFGGTFLSLLLKLGLFIHAQYSIFLNTYPDYHYAIYMRFCWISPSSAHSNVRFISTGTNLTLFVPLSSCSN